MAEPSNPFQDALNEQIRIYEEKKAPPRRTTTVQGAIVDIAKESPRGTLTTAAGTYGTYSIVKGWKAAYKEGLDIMRARAAKEGKAVAELTEKGVQAIPRFEGGNAAIRTAAKEYAWEKIFSGWPFRNQEAINRVADLRTPRVIATGETIPVTTFKGTRADLFKEGSLVKTTTPSPVGQAVTPRQITTETAGKIPKLTTSRQVVNMASPETWQGSLYEAGQVTGPNRVASAPAYTPPTARKPSLPRRLAEISTGGKLGKTNVALETAAALYDIGRDDGEVRAAWNEHPTLGIMKGVSRTGRAAANSISLGLGEFTGIYDTMDLLDVEKEARNRYINMSYGPDRMRYPVIVVNGERVPVEGSPMLKALEAQVAAERNIETSLITDPTYLGPKYNYRVVNGQVQPALKPEYAMLAEEDADWRVAMYNRRRPMLNINPEFGALGWQEHRPDAFNFGDYTDYMLQR